jgi:hypothetical protein
LLNKLE